METLGDPAPRAAITAICDEFETHGWRRVRAALRQKGVLANHKRILRLRREQGLQPKRRRRFGSTTDNNHDGPLFPDHAKDLMSTGRDQFWVANLFYVVIPGDFTVSGACEATTRAAKSLVLSPHLVPAALWCSRIDVLSIICGGSCPRAWCRSGG
jgi:hypothetical protein